MGCHGNCPVLVCTVCCPARWTRKLPLHLGVKYHWLIFENSLIQIVICSCCLTIMTCCEPARHLLVNTLLNNAITGYDFCYFCLLLGFKGISNCKCGKQGQETDFEHYYAYRVSSKKLYFLYQEMHFMNLGFHISWLNRISSNFTYFVVA